MSLTPRMKFSLFITSFYLGLVTSCVAGESIITVTDDIIHQKQSTTWCVVKPGDPDFKLQSYLDEKCTVELNCKEVQPGGSCFEPNTLQNHASYVLNLFFREHGECDSDLGAISINDPSFGRCHYP